MDKDKHTKSTVEITSEALSKLIKENNYTPEQLQTIYMSQMVILLAALDDDMKELIKTLKDRSSDAKMEEHHEKAEAKSKEV